MQQSHRLGSALRRGLFLLYRPSPSFCVYRSYASAKLFVGGLSFRTQEDALRNAFAAHGEVTDVRIVMDRESGRSRGFGFVTFLSEEEAETAFSKMNGKILDGRAIRVDRAAVRPPPSRPFGDSAGGFSSSSSDFSRSPAFDSSPSPPVQEDWGSIPSFDAQVPQNVNLATSSSAVPESKPTDSISSSAFVPESNPTDSFSSSTFEPPPVINPPYTNSPPLYTNSPSITNPPYNNSPSTSPPPYANSPSTTPFDSTPQISNNDSLGPMPFAASKPDDPPPFSKPSFDFGSFSSSSYDEPPLPRRKPRPRPRPISQSVPNFNFGSTLEGTSSPFGSTSEFETIAKPKGPEFDFGMSDISPLKSEPGARPQGGFDIDIPANLEPLPPPPPPKPKPLGFSIFQPRIVAPEGLPYDTPEADNWSEIGEDPPKLYLTSIYSPLRGFVSKDKELHWDPYDFDEEAKLFKPDVSADSKPPETEASLA